MAKLFSTKTHGVLDYLTAGQLLFLPQILGLKPELSRFVQAMGMMTALYSLLTRYELGAVKLLPMPAHLALDMIGGVSFGVAALVSDDESSAARTTLAALGVFEIFAGLSTETRPAQIGMEKSFTTVSVDHVMAPLRARKG